jgi:putative oxidoreductase
VALGLFFLQTGGGKFVNHDAYVQRFERWGLPEPGVATYATGSVEVVMGLLLLAGVLVRPAALLLLGTMVGAVLTAGRVDGGRDLWLPPLVGLLLAVLIRVGGGRLQLQRSARVGPPLRGHERV